MVYAPFYDRHAEAVDALADRLAPRTLRVLVQPDHTVADGAFLAAAAERHGGQVLPIRPEQTGRYYHGKLVAWSADGQWSALTGSPNISTPALLRATAEGGNCELGLVTDLPSDAVIPDTEEALSAEAAARIAWPTRDEPKLGLVLLAAVGTDEGLRLTLDRTPVAPATLHAADADVWTPVAELPRNEKEVIVPVPPHAGTPVRVVDADGRVSNTVFVLGQRALRRSVRHQGRVLLDPDTVGIDLAGAEAFAQDLYDLLPWVPQHKKAPPTTTDGGSAPEAKPAEHESWEQYLERCEAAIGERMLHFAFRARRETARSGLLSPCGRTSISFDVSGQSGGYVRLISPGS